MDIAFQDMTFQPSKEDFFKRQHPTTLAWRQSRETRGIIALTGPNQADQAIYGLWLSRVVACMSEDDVRWHGGCLCIDLWPEVCEDTEIFSARIKNILDAFQRTGTHSDFFSRFFSDLVSDPRLDPIIEFGEEQSTEALYLRANDRNDQGQYTKAGLIEFWDKMLSRVRVEAILFCSELSEAELGVKKIKDKLGCSSLSSAPECPLVSLTPGSSVVCKEPTGGRVDVATVYFYVGPYSQIDLSACGILETISSTLKHPEGGSLRGVIFGSNFWFEVRMNSNDMSADILHSEMDKFLQALEENVNATPESSWGDIQRELQKENRQEKEEFMAEEPEAVLRGYLTKDFWTCPWSILQTRPFHEIRKLEALECFRNYLSPYSKTRARLSILGIRAPNPA